MTRVALLTPVIVLALACTSAQADAKKKKVGKQKDGTTIQLLSRHETQAIFVGVEYRLCKGRTAACPERCGNSGEFAIFKIDKYLKYEKPGKYGDAKATERMIQISDFDKKPKGDLKLNATIESLNPGDEVLLSWDHNRVTTKDGKTRSSGPQRITTKLEKVAE